MQKNRRLKNYYSILLLLVLLMRPLYHIGYVAYFQLNIDYIIETYCTNKEKPELKCNGNCHLAKQLSISQRSENDFKDFTGFINVFLPVYFHKQSYSSLMWMKCDDIKPNWKYIKNKVKGFVSKAYHPPELKVFVWH